MFPFDQLDRLEQLSALDPVVAPLRTAVQAVLRPPRLADALHGTWLGHPTHPVLVQLPLGALASASVLDVLAGEDGERGADLLAAVGLAAALPAAAAGAADWSRSNPSEQRTGLVHALANTVGLLAWLASVVQRRRGARRPATALGLAGMTAMAVGGTIGGHLSYRRGLGANSTADIGDTGPTDWTDAGPAAVAEGEPVLRQAGRTSVLLYREGDRVDALVDLCNHQSGPLHEGEISDGCVTCPWHGSRFRLADGGVVHGPSTHPQPALDTRTEDGRLQVRLRQ